MARYFIDLYINVRGRADKDSFSIDAPNIDQCRATVVSMMMRNPKAEIAMVQRFADGGRGSLIGNIHAKKGRFEWYSPSGAAIIDPIDGTIDDKLPKPGRSYKKKR